MSVQVLCPACGYVAELHAPPVTDCAGCRVPFPDALRDSTDRALRRERAPMPMLLVLGQWLSLISGAVFLMFIVLAPFDLGSFSINGEPVSGPEFLRRGGWLMGVVGALLLAIAVGLLREKAWARPMMVLYWIAVVALTLVAGGRENLLAALPSAVMMAVAFGVAVWYLYHKPNVRAYFESRADDASRSAGSPSL